MSRFSYTRPGGMYSERRGSTKKNTTKKTTTKKSTVKKSTPKKKSFFSNFFNPKPVNTVSEASKLVQGTVLSVKGNYKSPKTGLQQARDDILMDLGIKDKDVDYYARLDDRKKRSQEAMKKMQERILKGDSGSGKSKPRGETAAERAARLKREALAKRRAEGKEKRRKLVTFDNLDLVCTLLHL